jgi:hypothetical protein
MARITAPGQNPAWWLPELVAALGPAHKDPDLNRWTWDDGDVGVFIDKLSLAWQTVVWSPHRSVTLRGRDRPTDADVTAAVALAGLHHHGDRGER